MSIWSIPNCQYWMPTIFIYIITHITSLFCIWFAKGQYMTRKKRMRVFIIKNYKFQKSRVLGFIINRRAVEEIPATDKVHKVIYHGCVYYWILQMSSNGIISVLVRSTLIKKYKSIPSLSQYLHTCEYTVIIFSHENYCLYCSDIHRGEIDWRDNNNRIKLRNYNSYQTLHPFGL